MHEEIRSDKLQSKLQTKRNEKSINCTRQPQ